MCGKPILAYVIDGCKKAGVPHVVSTEDAAIRQIAEYYGARVIDDPPGIVQGEGPLLPILQNALYDSERLAGHEYQYVIDLRNSPLILEADILGALDKLVTTGADSVIGVSKLDDHHPARIKKIVDDRLVDFCMPETSTRRQDLTPDAYIRNGTIYALTRSSLVAGHHYGTHDSRPWLMPPERGVNIDSDLDWILVTELVRRAHRS
jgi:CMP-N-acetylneuraminic acid synthetase